MKRILGILLAITAATILFTGCDAFGSGVSVDERMAMFQSDVRSGSFGSLNDDLHPDASMKNQANAAFWGTHFTAGSFSYTVSGDHASASSGGISYTFYLEVDGVEGWFGTAPIYKVRTVANDGGTIFN